MKFVKNFLKLSLIFVLAFSLLVPLPSRGAKAVTTTTTIKLWIGTSSMTVNGVKQAIDATGTKPIIIAGRTLVPIRAIIEALGGTVTWTVATQQIIIVLEKNSLELWIGKARGTLNGKTLLLDATNTNIIPLLLEEKTMLPFRFVGEALGAQVTYMATTKEITLVYVKSTTVLPPDNSDLLLGNPSNATSNSTTSPDNYLMASDYYALAYNKTRGEPNWVSWHLDSTSLGAIDRLNNFRTDTALPTGWYQVPADGYSGSGFDRGHNCPSADRTSSIAANASTFLMTNMIPQAPRNNEGTWMYFENYLRGLVKSGDELYIIMGSYGSGGTGSKGTAATIDGGAVAVPSHIWKIAVVLPNGTNDLKRITAKTRVIAINTPNINSINAKWQTYLTSVDAIEKATGDDFLSNVPVAIQKVIEAKVD
jgi:DNA/RNA endonuclease G (NUC1)